MKILFAIAERYPTHRQDVVALFGKYLPRLGISSDVLAIHSPDVALPDWPAGRLLTEKAWKGRVAKHVQAFLNDLRLLWLAGRGYDAVQVRDKAVAALIGLIAARIAGIPFYYWMSFPIAEAAAVFARDRGLSVGIARWAFAMIRARITSFILYKMVLPRADHVFVQSERMLANVEMKGVDRIRMTAVPMGFDPETLCTTNTGMACEKSPRPTFVYLGTLNRVRAPEIMLAAIDIVQKRFPKVLLLLVGDADEESDRRWLRSLIVERGLSGHVEMTGWLPATEGWALAAKSLAGLSPVPRSELMDVGSPTKAVEYFALGIPVIANDQPDQAIVLAGAGGTPIPFTAEAFANEMLEVIARPTAYGEQGRVGQQWVRSTRSYERLAQTVAGVYAARASLARQSV